MYFMESKLKGLSDAGLYWYNHIKVIERNRESAVDYTKRHNLNIQTLYDWKHRFFKTGVLKKSAGKQIHFQKISVQEAKPETNITPVKIYFPNGIVLEIQAGCTDTRIVSLLKNWL